MGWMKWGAVVGCTSRERSLRGLSLSAVGNVGSVCRDRAGDCKKHFFGEGGGVNFEGNSRDMCDLQQREHVGKRSSRTTAKKNCPIASTPCLPRLICTEGKYCQSGDLATAWRASTSGCSR